MVSSSTLAEISRLYSETTWGDVFNHATEDATDLREWDTIFVDLVKTGLKAKLLDSRLTDKEWQLYKQYYSEDT